MQEKEGYQYKTTWAATGSALCEAIESKNWDQAEFVYREAEVEYQRYNGSRSDYAVALATFKALQAARAAVAAAEAAQLIAGGTGKPKK
jgi:hypothetical protein